jgi:hypothetical protein
MNQEPSAVNQGPFGRKMRKLLTAHCGLLAVLCLFFLACPKKEPPREKVANPMIDSAEKFTEAYTETIPVQTGLDVFLDILKPKTTGSGQESLPADSVGEREARSETLGSRSSETAKAQDSAKGERVVLMPDTIERVYNPGTVEMIAIVHHVGLEGGFWGLTGENGQNYDPLNLPEALQQAGLRVRFWLRMRKDLPTTHMWGTPVQIVAYSIPKR